MKRIAIYTRKSKNTLQGDSIGTQINLVKDYFRNIECKFEIFQDEGFSGGNTNRPAFKIMMNRITEFDIVAVYKMDRISRKITDFFDIFNQLEKKGVSLVSVTENFDISTPSGMMIVTVLAGVAEMERRSIKQRVKDNMLELAKQGKWSGGNAPIGYKTIRVKQDNGKFCSYLEVNENEVDIIKDVYRLFLEGYGTKVISNTINEKYRLKTSPTRISNVLKSPIYVKSSEMLNNYLKLNNFEVIGEPTGKGYLTYQKRTTNKEGNRVLDKINKTIAAISFHDPIVSDTDWIKVQEKIKKVSMPVRPRKSKYTFLAHMVKCGYCGKNMMVESDTRSANGIKRFFRKTCKCNHMGTYDNREFYGSRLTIENAEKFVLAILERVNISGVETIIESNKSSYTGEYKANINKLEKELKKIDKMINSLTDKLALASDNTIDILMNKLEEYATDKKYIQEKILIQQQRLDQDKNKINSIEILDKKVNYVLKVFNDLPLEDKRIEISNIFEYFTWKGDIKEFGFKIRDL